ncbi:MAG: hypothetical protein U0M08_04325 [Clostridia bacterium]|nr:hypothetical protein [Clostridia bacterium]
MKLKVPTITVIFLTAWFVAEPNSVTAATLAAAAVHELGHIAAAKLMRIGISTITLLPLGADISFSRMRSYREELVTASAGAAFNLVIAVFCLPLAKSEFANLFVTSNIALAVINLLPIKTLDGGGTLKSVLLICFPQDTADRISSFISSLFLLTLWLLSVFLMLSSDGGFSLFALCSAIFISVYLD